MGPCKELLRNFKEKPKEQELGPVIYFTKQNVRACLNTHSRLRTGKGALLWQIRQNRLS